MESEIEELLASPPEFNEEDDLRSFITKAKNRIALYERFRLEEGLYDEEAERMVNRWRKSLSETTAKNRGKLRKEGADEEHSDVFEAVKLVARQIHKADENLSILDRSTLKLVGLNYSSRDIENEINKAREIMVRSKREEMKEIWMVYAGMLILLLVCLAIFLDKLVFSSRS